MKKKLSVLMAVLLAVMMVLTACGGGGGNNDEEEIKAAIDGFMGAVKSGEYSKLADYTTEDAVIADDFRNTDKLDEYLKSFSNKVGIDASDIPEDAVSQLNEFINNVKTSLVKSYEIGEIAEEDDKAVVPGTVTFGFDLDIVNDLDLSEEFESMVTEYVSNNMSELMEIYSAEGQEGITKKVISDLLGDILNVITEIMNKSEETVKDVTFTVVKQDDNWLISKVEEG